MRSRKVLVAAFLSLGLSGCQGDDRAALVVSGRVEKDRVNVGSKIGGRISKVVATEGDRVPAGGLVVQLEPSELEAELAHAVAREAEARAQLDLLLAGTRVEDLRRAEAVVAARRSELELRRKGFRAEEVREAEAQLASAKTAAELAVREHARTQGLEAKGVAEQQRLDSARAAVETARAALEVAEQRLGLVRSGSRPEEIAVAEAQLAQAVADLDRLKNGARPEEIAAVRASHDAFRASTTRIRTQLAETEIRAPQESFVETLDLQPGDLVRGGQTVATLELDRAPWVRCYVPENRLGWVRPGREVSVTVDSFPGKPFKGVIRKVDAQAEFTPRNVQTTEKRVELVYEMKVDVKDAGTKLRAGMYADVRIAAESP